MLELFASLFTYPFMLRAFLAGTLLALCAALLGVILVLRRFSMIGDGLSHVGFGAMALATVMNASPLPVALPVVCAASVFLLRFTRSGKTSGDAALAMLSTGSMALGVLLISMTEGMNVDVYNYLFGSILSMSKGMVLLSAALSVLVLVLYIAFYNRLFALTFDETFARATGTRTGAYDLLLALLSAVVIVLGMRMMGALLISALVVFPALTSMRVFRTFRGVVLDAALMAVLCVWIGLTASWLFAAPAGASIVLALIAVYLVHAVIGLRRG